MAKPITSGTVISTEDDFDLTTEDGRLLVIEAAVAALADQKYVYVTCGTFTDTETYDLLDYGGFIR